MINDIMENIENVVSNKSNGLKTKIYSGIIEIFFDMIESMKYALA
jgi:hypothetical protein